jgi:hypothetical protein
MKAYYSIVSISSSSHLNERFNIGLLCVDDDQAFFHYSKTKFKILGRLFSKSARELALSTLNSIDKSVDDANALNEKKNQFFDSSKELNKLSSDYLNYLNRYNNNLIQFSAPKSIDLEINRDVFEKLFQKYIFENEDFNQKVISERSQFEIEYPIFLENASRFVNTNYQVTKELIPSLITPKKVDMIGKNGSFNLAHSIDFKTTVQTLNHHLDSYMYLALSSELAEDKHAKCFILGEEPVKKSKNHTTWKNVREVKQVEFVSFDEKEKIIEHFRKTNVKPLPKN